MPIVRGCHLPDHLLYDVENHTWYQEQEDGTIRIGMTAVATALAGELVAFTPKKIGRSVKTGKSCATIESGKWVGPARVALDGEIVAVNETLIGEPNRANRDPYEDGWMVEIKTENWEGSKNNLIIGSEVATSYEAKMEADSFEGCDTDLEIQ